MRKLWKPSWCSIPGFLFFMPSDLLHASRRRVRFFVSGESLRSEAAPVACRKTGSAGLFFVPGESLRSEVAPVACRETGGVRELFFCFRRIGPVPKHRPADGRSAGLRRNCPNSPQWFALRAESIRKTLSDCLETRCGEGVCYEIVKYI